MSAGTLTLTNNSATVTGSGTSFTTELTAADFIVVTVGGIPYTLPVKTVDSGTALTLVSNFTGPTQAGAAWYAVPRVAMNLVTAALVAQSAEALRGLNYDKQNWQQIFSGTGTVTVKLPDGSTFTGPAWNSFTTALNGKAKAGANSDITSLSGLTTALSVEQGGTGQKTAAGARTALGLKGASVLDVGTVADTVAAGDDSRLNTVNGKTGGTLSSGIAITTGDLYLNNGNYVAITPVTSLPAVGQYVNGGLFRTGYSGYYAPYYTDIYTQTVQGAFTQSVITLHASNIQSWVFNQSGNATAPGSWVSGSDERHKSNIVLVPDALEAVLSWRGCTYDKKDGVSEVGLIAQDVEKNCPIAVFNTGRRKFSDNTVIEDFKSLNVAGASAAYHTEAIKALFGLVKLALDDPAAARERIAGIETTLRSEENQRTTEQ